MPEVYPCALPGVRVNSNGYSPQELVRSNNVQNGPPRFRLQADSGWLQFNVGWSFDQLQTQVFENWFKHTLRNGSKSFNIELQVAGGLLEHECYFVGVPQYTQNQRRWSVTASLLAISRVGLSECDGESLIAMFNVFEEPNKAITQMDTITNTLETLWLP